MIYLDHNATTAMLPEVVDAMEPWAGVPANASSVHRLGQRAAMAVDQARSAIADLVGGDPAGVVLTSGATEANHAFLRGFTAVRCLVCSAIEHPSVLGAAEQLEAEGVRVVRWRAGRDGVVRVEALPGDVGLVSLMAANHETGVLQPVAAVRALSQRAGVPMHVDATQAAGRVPLALSAVDGVTLSAHKLGGPAGIGALVLGTLKPDRPLLTGGSQQRGRRAGTVPVQLAVGFGAACALAGRRLAERSARWQRLSDALRRELTALGGRVVGDPDRLLPNTTCVVFPGVLGEALVQALDLAGFAVSSGAACASGSTEPSPVLTAMGDPEPGGAVRVSLGEGTSEDDVRAFARALPPLLEASVRGAEG